MRARLVLLAAALVAFGASLGSGFHFDDYAIFSDPALQSARGWLAVWAPLQTRPLTYITFWLNRQMGAGDPLGYHLFNLLDTASELALVHRREGFRAHEVTVGQVMEAADRGDVALHVPFQIKEI